MPRLAALVATVLLLHFVGCLTASLPVFTTSGTHYQVGFNAGQNFADRINGWVQNYDNLNEVLLPFYATSAGKSALSYLIEQSSAKFPLVWSEIQGLIAGSNASTTAMLLLAFEDELSALAPPSLRVRSASSPFQRCTDVLYSNYTLKANMFGHNEDADPLTSQYAYILNATYLDGRGKVIAQIFAFNYPGVPPGEAWGVSSNKLAFSQNAVFPVNVYAEGIGNQFLARSAYDCANVACVISLLTAYNKHFASGFSMNVGSYADLSNITIYNIEIARNSTSVLQLSGNYTHVNLYEHSPSVQQYPDPSSSARLNASYAMATPSSQASILAVLGNTQNTQYPVYRNGAAPDCCSTITTTFYDLGAKTVTYWYSSNPSSSSPVATMPLL